jgi:hypothetical protein
MLLVNAWIKKPICFTNLGFRYIFRILSWRILNIRRSRRNNKISSTYHSAPTVISMQPVRKNKAKEWKGINWRGRWKEDLLFGKMAFDIPEWGSDLFLSFLYHYYCFFICLSGAWTQGLHLEPCYQLFFVKVFFFFSLNCFAQAGFKPRSSLFLLLE